MCLKFLWVQEESNSGRVDVRKVKGTENATDVATKHVTRPVLEKCMNMIGLCAWDRASVKVLALAGTIPTVDASQDEFDESDGSWLVALVLFLFGVLLAASLAAFLVRCSGVVKGRRTVATQTEEYIECIYVSGYGEKFHLSSTCDGLRSRRTPLKCFKPCKICVG